MKLAVFVGMCSLVLSGAGAQAMNESSSVSSGNTEVLLDKRETTMTNQRLFYPAERQAQVTSLVLTLAPGERIQTHQHPVPLYGYILDGELTITYEKETPRSVTKGEAFIEALNTWHYGENTGNVPLRLLVVYIGAEGLPNMIVPPE